MDDPGSEHGEELELEPTATVRTRRPRALWAVLAVIGVVAGALVVTSAGDDGDQRPGLPVDLASAARSGGGDAEAAADSSMLAWVTYVPGDDLPALGGEATAYRLTGEVDEAQVGELAGALGLEGAVEQGPDGSWSVTGEDGQSRLDVHGASWSYFGGYADCASADGGVVACGDVAYDRCLEAAEGKLIDCAAEGTTGGGSSGKPMCEPGTECVEPTTTTVVTQCSAQPPAAPCPPDDTVVVEPPPNTGSGCTSDDCVARCEETGECPEPVPSADLPSEDDAREAALAVVAASGADVDGARVTAEPGFATWFITVEPEVDGMPSGLSSYVEIGPDLQVTSGTGHVGQPEALGEYPLLDTRAAIERANAQSGSIRGIEPAIGAADAASGTTGGADTGGTTVGGVDDVEATVSTVVDPCSTPEGAPDGCGGTTGCGGDGCVEPTTTVPCKVQPDGSEICEASGCENGTMSCPPAEPCPVDVQATTTVPCAIPECPQAAATDGDVAVGAPEVLDCTPPPPVPVPVPEPEPIEIVLVDAEHSLVLLPANDGTGDAYLVPAYRFTVADGGTVDLPAVADEALAGPATTETTVPDTVEPAPVPVPEPQPCEVLEEEDPGTGTTHTIQTCPTPNDDALEVGGKGYYVDIDVQCASGSFVLGGRIWVTESDEVAGWADPGERHEGGTFTLDAEDHGTFVGDAAGNLTAEFRTLGPADDIFCTPEPR